MCVKEISDQFPTIHDQSESIDVGETAELPSMNSYCSAVLRFMFVIVSIVGLAHPEVTSCGKAVLPKPLRCVCGKLIDMTGGPASGVRVTVLQRGVEVTNVETGDDGRFVFAGITPGKYELRITDPTYWPFKSDIVVQQQTRSKCKCKLTILLDAGGLERCGSRIVKQ